MLAKCIEMSITHLYRQHTPNGTDLIPDALILEEMDTAVFADKPRYNRPSDHVSSQDDAELPDGYESENELEKYGDSDESSESSESEFFGEENTD